MHFPSQSNINIAALHPGLRLNQRTIVSCVKYFYRLLAITSILTLLSFAVIAHASETTNDKDDDKSQNIFDCYIDEIDRANDNESVYHNTRLSDEFVQRVYDKCQYKDADLLTEAVQKFIDDKLYEPLRENSNNSKTNYDILVEDINYTNADTDLHLTVPSYGKFVETEPLRRILSDVYEETSPENRYKDLIANAPLLKNLQDRDLKHFLTFYIDAAAFENNQCDTYCNEIFKTIVDILHSHPKVLSIFMTRYSDNSFFIQQMNYQISSIPNQTNKTSKTLSIHIPISASCNLAFEVNTRLVPSIKTSDGFFGNVVDQCQNQFFITTNKINKHKYSLKITIEDSNNRLLFKYVTTTSSRQEQVDSLDQLLKSMK